MFDEKGRGCSTRPLMLSLSKHGPEKRFDPPLNPLTRKREGVFNSSPHAELVEAWTSRKAIYAYAPPPLNPLTRWGGEIVVWVRCSDMPLACGGGLGWGPRLVDIHQARLADYFRRPGSDAQPDRPTDCRVRSVIVLMAHGLRPARDLRAFSERRHTASKHPRKSSHGTT